MALVVQNLTGQTSHSQVEITRSCMKLLVNLTVPNADYPNLTVLDKGKITLSIQGNNGQESKICQDLPFEKLFEFAQQHEGFMRAIKNSTTTTLKGLIDLSPDGAIMLKSDEKIVATITDVNTTWKFDIYSIESANLVNTFYVYNTINVPAGQTQRKIQSNNDEYLLLPTINLNQLELEQVGSNTQGQPMAATTKATAEELEAITCDSNDIVRITIDNTNAGAVSTEYGIATCHILSIDKVNNYEVLLSGSAAYNMYSVNIATR